MGIYDRDYQRGGDYGGGPGFYVTAPRMMNTNIILVTCLLYVVQKFAGPWWQQTFELHADWFRRPWTAYQLLTYGFLHAPDDLWHIVLNMAGLFFFGRDVEWRYGRREYLVFYLVGIVVSGIVWTLAEVPTGSQSVALGASGGVIAVVILFAFNFPFRTVLFMFFLPMPMWVAAVIFVVIDTLGAMNVNVARGGQVAFTAHLGGALFAFLYYQWGGRLERFLPSSGAWRRFRARPKLRVHDPDADPDRVSDSRVDEILKKIQEHGQDSLTYGERRVLEDASREYQKKRK